MSIQIDLVSGKLIFSTILFVLVDGFNNFRNSFNNFRNSFARHLDNHLSQVDIR